MVALIRNSVILCFVVNGGSALWEEIAGPYDLNFHHVSHCDKKGKIDALIPMKVSKLNRTHFVYSGRIDLGADADDNLKVRVVAANKGTNGRYNNVIDIEMKVCEIVQKFGMKVIESVFEHCNISGECPLKRVTCEMKNWLVNYNIENIPALPYGEYRADASFMKIHQYNRKELISCTRVYGSVTPKIPTIQKKISSSKFNNTMQ
ncbi:uncharacterized protein LOC120353079 [Nilaparvata lugens]|uniref:uncharacterized protein LOC120353079 n=1 Tax=Nilaparvata lugens TaxID=108931 RepID=UPI00193D3942|nr:uncharacterized protein LOC120353079 [Nilaparvata lugens]